MDKVDRDLGMGRPISRRDFVDGIAAALVGTAGSPETDRQAEPTVYPPARTGLRGSHEGSFEPFHLLRDGHYWENAPSPEPTGESFDLVVVGAGISGLSAAHFFRKAHPRASILVLDNHDDFGGHAKRNEFRHAGRTYLGYGGTFAIESPAPYSSVAKGLIEELGIDVSRYGQMLDRRLYPNLGLRPGFFFDRETFGVDKLVRGSRRGLDEALVNEAPISESARRDLARLGTDPFDPFPGETEASKRAKLARMSYASYLTDVLKLDRGVLPLFQVAPHSLFGVGIDAVSAQDAFGIGLPGFKGVGLSDRPGPGQNYDAIRSEAAERYFLHFPDGNASIARLLVRRLIPGSIPGRSMDDVVTGQADYSRLDRAGSPVRIRLSSVVMRVRHQGASPARAVEVAYLKGGKLRTVVGKSVILACWHAPIPHMCPELPAAQKEALGFAIKVPLVYTNVLVRRWTSFTKLGVHQYEAPGLWHTSVGLDLPVSVGRYRHPVDPNGPIVLHLTKSACRPGLPIREQHRAGRNELFATPFETIERRLRSDLGRVLSPGGFDPAADILALTVNRWPHGYAYQYNSLWDDFWFEGKEQPCQVARRRFGQIAIANADAAAYSYTDAAIDHAARAVRELTDA